MASHDGNGSAPVGWAAGLRRASCLPRPQHLEQDAKGPVDTAPATAKPEHRHCPQWPSPGDGSSAGTDLRQHLLLHSAGPLCRPRQHVTQELSGAMNPCEGPEAPGHHFLTSLRAAPTSLGTQPPPASLPKRGAFATRPPCPPPSGLGQPGHRSIHSLLSAPSKSCSRSPSLNSAPSPWPPGDTVGLPLLCPPVSRSTLTVAARGQVGGQHPPASLLTPSRGPHAPLFRHQLPCRRSALPGTASARTKACWLLCGLPKCPAQNSH